jgi:cytochrome c553
VVQRLGGVLLASMVVLWIGPPTARGSELGSALQAELARCEACHGPRGRAGTMPYTGRIAGQNETYLVYILRQYRAGHLSGVNAAIMTYATKQLNDAQIRSLAHYYAQLQ